ncbi:hypothetical protein O9993_05625 [Vibrio lentus]|nr:hypothetical protein [Vibrio lentus]
MFSSVVSVASFATGASFAARRGNGDGLRLAHAALSVAVSPVRLS